MDKQFEFDDLPEQDVTVHCIVSKLSIRDCFVLRAVSKRFQKIVETYFESMKYVNLSNYRTFNIQAFEVLTQHCRNVHYLYLSKCNWITTESLEKFIRNNHHLHSITLNYCSSIGPKIFEPITESCKELHTLYLVKCIWVTSDIIESFTDSKLNNLQCVDFSYCAKLSEHCIIDFVKKFRNLESLSLAYINSVSNNAMEVISKHLVHLKHLNIAGCSVTNAGLRLVIENCKELKSLVAARRSFNEEILKTASIQIHVGFAPEQYFSETSLIKQTPRMIIPDKKVRKNGLVNRLKILREKL